jgi:uncharacterized membrane protein YwzB
MYLVALFFSLPSARQVDLLKKKNLTYAKILLVFSILVVDKHGK